MSERTGSRQPASLPSQALDFRALFESAPGLYLVLTPDLMIVAVSDGYLKATMTERQAILGRGLFEVFPDNPDDPQATGVPNLSASLERVLRNKVPDAMAVQKYDIRRPEAEGGGFEERFWSPVNSPVFGTGGEVAYIIHRVEDVTEFVRLKQRGVEQEKQAQEMRLRGEQMETEIFLRAQQLQEANRQLRQANEELNRLKEELERRVEERTADLQSQREQLHVTLTSIGDGVIAADAEGRVTFLNPVASSLTGWTAEKAMGRPLAEVFPIVNEQTRQPVENPAQRALNEGVVVGLANHTVLIGKDGTERPIDDCAAPIRDEEGTLRGVVLVFRDITEKRRTEAELAMQRKAAVRKRRLYEAALSNTPDLVYVFDLDHRFTYANEVLLKMWGKTWDEAIGKTCLELGYERWHAAMHDREIEQVVATRQPVKGEVPFTGTFGRRIYKYIFVPVLGENGEVEAVAGTTRDVTDRKQAEEALREASATLRSFYDTAPVMMGVVEVSDDDILHLTDNAATGRFFGIDPERLARRRASEMGVPEDHLREWVCRYRESERTGQPIRFEYPHETPGGIRWVSAIVYCMERLPGGRIRCSYVAEDVTERKQVEEALRQSEQRFARFMQHLPGLAWIKDLQGRYVYANDAALKAFHCTWDGLYGKTDEEVLPPETATQFKQNDRKALTSEAGVQVIETLEQPDGVVHHSVVNKFPILAPDGNPALVGGMAIDITDRLKAEKVLAESEERFRQLAENVNEVFWMTDPQTTQFLYISPAYERVWGRSCQSLYENPRSFLDAVHPDDRERVRADVLEKQSRGKQIDKEYRVVRPDGSVRWVRDRAFPVRNAAGQFYRLVGIVDDFTEKKQAEEALKEANRRKDEFLATLAHELRNPLAPIRNAVELMRRANGDGSVTEMARSMMERQVGQMVRLVDDLLDISRITRGKLHLRKERVELAAVVNSAVETSRPLIDAQAHDLTVTLPQGPVRLDADPVRLAQVFSNLLNNAAKYTEKGGHIWLTAERQGAAVVVSVRDTGIGIAADHLPRLFQMFSQVSPALERSQGGLGIGLALVRGLVELHGGSVTVRSAGLGRGSEFTVLLPVVGEPVPARPEPSADGEKRCGGPQCRILVADDLRDSADSLALMLQLAGHEVQAAHDGLEAVQAAATFRPDVVLLDIGMPKMNGYEAARHIRQQPWGKDVLLIALTGWGQEEDRRRTFEAGFDHHLTKPVEPAALEKLLAGLKSETA